MTSFFQARESEEGRLKEKLNELLGQKSSEKATTNIDVTAPSSPDPMAVSSFAWTKINPTGKGPAPRWGHSANLIGKKVHIFGGSGMDLYGDYSVLDIELMAWLSPMAMGSMPCARFGHSATSAGTKLCIFGGQGAKQYNDLYVLDTENAYWTRHSPEKSWPEPRAGHTLTYIHSSSRALDVAVGFGGHTSKQKYLNDVYVLERPAELRKPSWSYPTVRGTPPTGRSSHSATAVGEQLYIIGGFDGRRYFNDVHVLDVAGGWTWRTLNCSGKAPTPRSGHTATLIGRLLFIIGGCGTDSAFFNDVFALHVDTATWYSIQISSGSFEPRFKHSTLLVRSEQMFVFGGTSAGSLYSDLCALSRVAESAAPAEPGPLVAQDSWEELDPHHWVRNPLPLEAPTATTEMYMSAVMTLHAERDQRIMLEGLVETLLRAIQTEKDAKEKTSSRTATLEGDLIAEQEARKKAEAERQRLEQALRAEQDKRTKLDKTAKSEREKRQKAASARETAEAQLERVTKSLRDAESRVALLEDRLASEQQQRAVAETELAAVRKMHQELDTSHSETLRRLKRYLETFRNAPSPSLPSAAVVSPAPSPLSSASISTQLNATPLSISSSIAQPASPSRSTGSSPSGSRIAMVPDPAPKQPRPLSQDSDRSSAGERLQRILSVSGSSPAAIMAAFEAQQLPAPAAAPVELSPDIVQLLQRPLGTLSSAELSRLERQQFVLLERISTVRDQRLSTIESEKQRLRVEKIILEEREGNARKALSEDRKVLDQLALSNQQLKAELASVSEKLERSQKESRCADGKLHMLAQTSDAMAACSTPELDQLEEFCHTALRRIAAARQEKFRVQLEELKREKEQLQEARKCIVCTDREISTVILPCGHRTLCRACAQALDKCPVCRTTISKTVDTY